MTTPTTPPPEVLAREVRLYLFSQAAETARVPQPPQLTSADMFIWPCCMPGMLCCIPGILSMACFAFSGESGVLATG